MRVQYQIIISIHLLNIILSLLQLVGVPVIVYLFSYNIVQVILCEWNKAKRLYSIHLCYLK